MRRLAALVCLPLGLAGCGSNVAVESRADAGAATTTSTISTSSTSTATTGTTTTTTTTTIGVDGGGGAPPVCRSCASILAGADPEEPACAGSQALWDAFRSCACVQVCPYPCGALCTATPGPMSVECTECVKSSCADTFSACLADP